MTADAQAVDASAPRLRARIALTRDPIWIDAILPTVAIRVVMLLGGLLLVVVFRPDALTADLLGIWARWDAPHFFEVARYGYGPPADPARIVLFPLYPALIATGSFIASPLIAGMLVSFVSTLAAAAGIYRLVRFDHDRRTARAAVLAMSLFPTAFAFVAPYSEATFLALVAWALVAARHQDWRSAGVLTLFAGATRLQGAFLVPALALEYLIVRRRIDRDILWVLVGLGGPLIYLGINWATFGDPLYFLEIQASVFQVRTVAPWVSVPALVGSALTAPRNEFWATVYLAPLAAFVMLAAVFVWTVVSRRSRPSYAAFAALNLVTLLTLSWPISVPRYILGVAPLFIWLGTILRGRVIGPPVMLALGMGLTVCTALFLIGHWAF